ncbi:MAG: glycosyltransferase family 9 protein, partial [Holophaga sp.]
MFLRYLPLVKALGGTVFLETQPALTAVAATCGSTDLLIPEGGHLPPFDLQRSLMSLPWVFRTDLESIPSDIPYVDVPAEVPNRGPILECLRRAEDGPRIGLVWAGRPEHGRDFERSIPAKSLNPLADLSGVAWFSLQHGNQEQPALPGLVPLSPFLSTFSDTAYALSGMDLVITVDTALAHLAGALGVPTFLLLPFQADFRWLLNREESPWYPT